MKIYLLDTGSWDGIKPTVYLRRENAVVEMQRYIDQYRLTGSKIFEFENEFHTGVKIGDGFFIYIVEAETED